MDMLTLLLLAVALGTDAFSVCVGVALTGVINRYQAIFITLTVLLLHILMPLTGWKLGEVTENFLGRTATVGGAFLLCYLGLKMLWESRSARTITKKDMPVGNWGMILLSLGVSIDALSVGFSLGTVKAYLPLAVAVFGLVAGIMTISGLLLGRFLGVLAGNRARLVGGFLLIGVGLKMIF